MIVFPYYTYLIKKSTNFLGSAPWAAPLLIAYCVFITPVWGYIAARNPFTKEVLDYGWTPVISAMLISR